MCFSMIMSLAAAGTVIAEVHYGGGRHIGDIPPSAYILGMEMNVLSGLFYVIGLAAVKVSVGFSLLRIAGHTRWKYLVIVIVTTISCWAFSSVFVSTSFYLFQRC